jgi:hypothetical protein
MKRSFQFQPRLELLDGRLPPSSVPVAPPILRSLPGWEQYFGSNWLPLSGSVGGTWSSQLTNPDAGQSQQLTGQGTVNPLGNVQATGHLNQPGNVANGHTTGEFTFTDAKGSVTIRVVSANASAIVSGVANKFYYSIEHGTGAFTRAWGGGIAYLTEKPQEVVSPPDPGKMAPDHIVAASFTLTLQPNV